ncbi:MAG: flagellar biosynthetic protein FliP, partial [Methylocystis sp.]|nr:flagellar biosynthetic protein FliP [Methylocystis sp.]
MKLPLTLIIFLAPTMALGADGVDLSGLLPANGASVSSRIVQLLGVTTALSIAPGLLIVATSFTRFAIALSFLRVGLGLQSAPANLVLISLALFMTFYVMTPVLDQSWSNGVKPLVENKIGEGEALARATRPFREFMLAHVRDKDVRLFEDLRHRRPGKIAATSGGAEELELVTLIPAFMISELR